MSVLPPDAEAPSRRLRSTERPPTPTAGNASNSKHDTSKWAVLLTLLYFGVLALGIAHHELWGDEVQAWMIARDSGSIPELLRNLQYEGHPAAWHLLLYALSRFTRDPVAMQALHLVLATGAVYLLARFSPFSWPQKALIAFGYFFVYEYAVISRSYVLGVLAVFAFCALFPYRRQSYLPLAVVLFFLANTSVYGLMLALALGATLLFESVVDPVVRGSLTHRTSEVAASIAIAGVGAVVSLVQIIPPADARFAGQALYDHLSGFRAAAHTLTRVWYAYVPIPDPFTPHLWESNLLQETPGLRFLAMLLSVLLVVGAARLFASRRAVLFLYLLGTGGMLLFIGALVTGSLRHHGHLFVLFIACLWLGSIPAQGGQAAAAPVPGWWPWERRFVLGILIAQLVAGATLWLADLRRPFYAGREVAAWIQARGLEDMVLFGNPAPHAAVVAAYLDRRIYYPETGGFDTFVPWERHGWLAYDQLAPEVLRVANDYGPEILVIVHRPFAGAEGLIVEEVARFPAGLTAPEHAYFVYRVSRAPGSGP
jgi:hypothetical protein